MAGFLDRYEYLFLLSAFPRSPETDKQDDEKDCGRGKGIPDDMP